MKINRPSRVSKQARGDMRRIAAMIGWNHHCAVILRELHEFDELDNPTPRQRLDIALTKLELRALIRSKPDK